MASSDIDRLLDRHREKFRRLLQSIVAEEQGPDPFTFALSRFRTAPEAQRIDLVRRAGLIARERVDEELRTRGAAWIVLLGDRIVAESTDPADCPSPDALLALGDEDDLVPFLFEAPLVEEIPATSSGSPLPRGDAYATIPLCIEETVLNADLDTGSHATFVDRQLVACDAATWFEGRHLGQAFLWAPGRARIAVRVGDGRIERSLPIRFVHDWAASPFVRINLARRALVGRDVLRGLGLELRLSASDLSTAVLAGNSGP